jgi:integrase
VATFRKRGPYQWQAQVRKKGYPLQTKTFDTRAAAATWARAIEHEMDVGSFISRAAAESTTLSELIDRYVDEVTPLKKGVVPESCRLRAFQRHPLASRFVATLRGSDFARYRDKRLQKVSPSTVRRDLSCLSHVFEVARKEWDVYCANPLRDIKMPGENKARDRRLNPGEEPRLLDACRKARNPFLLPVVHLAIETAMRRSEILGLRWEHVDLHRRTAQLTDTKSGTPRTVPLSTSAMVALQKLPRSINGQVFPGLTGEAVKLSFGRATRRANIQNLRFHDLRHEATTRLFEKGFNVMEVASITGHKDLRMLRRYTHLSAEDLAKRLG